MKTSQTKGNLLQRINSIEAKSMKTSSDFNLNKSKSFSLILSQKSPKKENKILFSPKNAKKGSSNPLLNFENKITMDTLPLIFKRNPVNIFKKNLTVKNPKGKKLYDVPNRKDSGGNLIEKGSKKHHVTFKDKLNANFSLVEYVDVVSYKEENAFDEYLREFVEEEEDEM